MAGPESNVTDGSEGGGLFTTTHWSVVLSAAQLHSVGADAALARLCQTYWYPLYVFVRRHGHSSEDAQDLVQGFFAKVLEKNYFADANPEKGRFRSFLLLALKRYMANEWDRSNRQKRGGGQAIISLDAAETETRYLSEPIDEASPEKLFDRQWALTLLETVLKLMESECVAAGNARVFQELKGFLTGDNSDRPYAEIARTLGINEGTLRGTVFRMRQRYRELIRQQIAQTITRPEEIENELLHLLEALS